MARYVQRKSTFNKKTNRKTLSRQTRKMKSVSRRSDGRVYPNTQTRRRRVSDNFKRELREKRRNSFSSGIDENFSRMGGRTNNRNKQSPFVNTSANCGLIGMQVYGCPNNWWNSTWEWATGEWENDGTPITWTVSNQCPVNMEHTLWNVSCRRAADCDGVGTSDNHCEFFDATEAGCCRGSGW